MILNEKAAIDTSQLRRSTRSTRYDGFRVPQPTDAKPTVSKVKPRSVTTVTVKSLATAPHKSLQLSDDAVSSSVMPPPTTIETIQCIGTRLCGIPASDLSPEELLASLQPVEPEEQ